MAYAILVEGMHAAIGATRQEINALIDEVGDCLEKMGRSLDQRIGAALASSNSDSERADAIMQISAGRGDCDGFQRDALRLVGSFVGAIWGGQVALAGANVTGTIVALGLGIEVAPIVAVIFGLLVLFYCGKYFFGVMKELLGRLESAALPSID